MLECHVIGKESSGDDEEANALHGAIHPTAATVGQRRRRRCERSPRRVLFSP